MKGNRGAEPATAISRPHRRGDQRHVRDLVLGAVSHDLRGPLSTVSMRAQVMLRSLPEGPEWAELRKHAATIDSAAKGMAQMLDSLLDIGSIEEGHLELDVT